MVFVVILLKSIVLIDYALTVKDSYLGVVLLFHLLRKGNQVLFINLVKSR